MKIRIAVIGMLIFLLIVGILIADNSDELFVMEKTISINSNSQHVLVNESGEVITVYNDNGGVFYKLFQVSERDDTFIRQLLANELWKQITDGNYDYPDLHLCDLRLDDEDKGLFIKSQSRHNKPDADISLLKICQENLDDEIVDYLVYLQYLYSYKNLFDNYSIYIDSSGKYVIEPKRVEFSFGILPKNYDYLNYKFENRIITPYDIGITDSQTAEDIYKKMKVRWILLREGVLSDENFEKIANCLADEIVNSGYVEMSGKYSSDDDFNASDYYYDSVHNMINLNKQRFEYIDMYYSAGSFEEASRFNEEAFIGKDEGFLDDFVTINEAGEKVYFYSNNGDKYCFLPSFCDVNQIEESNDGVKYLKSSNLLAVFVDTKNGTAEYIGDKKGNSEPGTIRCYNQQGDLVNHLSFERIQGKGHSSFMRSDKKSFKVVFSQKTGLFDFDKAYEYVFSANALDKSRIRNALAYTYAQDIGIDYTTDIEYVDLYLNGRYWGNYLLCNPVGNVGKIVFEINNLIDRELDENEFFWSDDIRYEIDFSDEKIDSELCEQLSDKMAEISGLIKTSSDLENYQILKEKIDIDSFEKMYLMDYIFDDVDANTVSTFYYFGNDNVLYAGPPWDYDFTLGNHGKTVIDNEIQSFTNGFPEMLTQSDGYKDELNDLWKDCREKTEALSELKVYELADLIKDSYNMERIRWDALDNISKSNEDYEIELNEIVEFINKKIEQVDKLLY